ncbi:Membrane-fusion protein [Ignavibacterium album JCM 16511]|uniref:Membrane-fusion protein n=1 Tax=Ignavibacterium album (strain DSM 19864 / JCM 16511 / NBRC 101810 / Mat9-16) TaxID=945713 RepID=I0ANR1_IGNAJ|nr:efflux RND transporter periplasmic adaptor subunit [Ignavibacterium album]AFH50618.1 Membrane-fusion protein [Ignavibacterium album JCM 16511]
MKTIKFLLLTFTIILLFIGCSNNNEKSSIEVTGTIESTNVIVSSKVAGEVISIFKDEGDKVSVGDTLLIIDPTIYKIKFREAEAVLLSAEAQYELVRNGARKEDIQQAEQLLKQSEINLQTAQNDKIRFENLYQTKSISKKQYEDALAKYELALAQFNSAKENFIKIQNISRPEELKQVKANVDRLKANVDLIKKNLNDCYVVSPISGIVVKRFVEAGETVTNLSSLVKISDLSQVELMVYVNEKDLPKIKLGQQVDVNADAFPEKTFKGKVIFISPEAEFTPKNIQTKEERTKLVFAVKVKIDNPDYELKSGIPADAIIKLQD